MPSLTLPTSASTETLLLKCQKETHKPPLPPTWTTHPPNQEIHPPRDTLALAIRIDAAAPTSIRFYDSATNRPVGSVGPEFRGSLVLVPWRPGLKFVVAPTCRRRSGCLVGIIREGKGTPPRATSAETPPPPPPPPQVVPEMASPAMTPDVASKVVQRTIPKVTANTKVKVTPKVNLNAITKKVGGKMKSHIPVAIPKQSTGSSGHDGKAQDGDQERPPRHGTAIPSPVSNKGSKRRRHVSFDDKTMMGKRSKMTVADR
ncbi:hypothetical protein BBK36DRAFT_1181947 [Trichoderma citrinoviride]|uniref:Uncharacterized protein n=1 Tax=Trichoderma citrinoviride TaxID=58853 RepID=A0A2T4B2H0_9HYPO|nr:hypothetical protein BBK36DRAFT_1181947 [Trichoderma citrinoviride]PTB63438.1 hypothetical protein BBK36DRAFT_1181947 [Trichoderma citrinoviride]